MRLVLSALSVSDPGEKAIADIKHQLRRRGGGLQVFLGQQNFHLVKDKNTDHATKPSGNTDAFGTVTGFAPSMADPTFVILNHKVECQCFHVFIS